ncbi:MAG: hypothetical protein CMB13_06010 [Euryarchaeota archaeon]|nr:hypothetical protein [Euryarchaeota archaeon]|tara:strand:+ start:567 stop:1235 length:669 start_codon:yes stop_codon:yes gene_type:complete
MGMKVDNDMQVAASNDLISAIQSEFGNEGVICELRFHAGGKQKRPYVFIECSPEIWLIVAETLSEVHGVDYCSMITGIHWPEKAPEMEWQVVVHLMRMSIRNPKSKDGILIPTITDASIVKGATMPLELEISIPISETRTPSIPSVQHIWVGADWNEKETWDLVGIDFDGHKEMRRVLQPHETPAGFHPLQKQHKLRYHDFNEMYDDAQGFMRKSEDIGKIK